MTNITFKLQILDNNTIKTRFVKVPNEQYLTKYFNEKYPQYELLSYKKVN